MRPDGVERIPPRDPIALLAAITRILADPVPTPRRAGDPDENLQAVLDLYTELSRELTR